MARRRKEEKMREMAFYYSWLGMFFRLEVSAELGCLCTVNRTLGKGCYFSGSQESLIDGT